MVLERLQNYNGSIVECVFIVLCLKMDQDKFFAILAFLFVIIIKNSLNYLRLSCIVMYFVTEWVLNFDYNAYFDIDAIKATIEKAAKEKLMEVAEKIKDEMLKFLDLPEV